MTRLLMILFLLFLPGMAQAESGFALFELGDTDQSGTLSEAEFRNLFHENEELEGMFRRYDIDDDRRMSKKEWRVFEEENWSVIGDELAR